MDDSWLLRMPWSVERTHEPDALLTREWLVTNGLGGYAAGTVSGAATRRYHGLLTAALPAPLGRQLMLGCLSELMQFPDGRTFQFGGEEFAGGRLELRGIDHLKEFRLEAGLPVWCYQIAHVIFEKRILLAYRHNTVFLEYRMVAGEGPVRLELHPSVHFRGHDAPVSEPHPAPYTLTAVEDRFELSGRSSHPPLRMALQGKRGAFTVEGGFVRNVFYREEAARGYEGQGDLWSPGYFRVHLDREHPATLVASTELWDTIHALDPVRTREVEMARRRRLIAASAQQARAGPARQTVLAADQFIITPATRPEDAARARASGDEPRTVIAGYHWFTDWGRDTMISLEGLTLATGRHAEAAYILRTFARALHDGLIPNLYPEGQTQGLYHTADATLWYFHALDRYLAATDDEEMLIFLLPKLEDVIAHHLRGTRFGIGVDPADGLLRQGEQGYQLTWMDAKVGDWVVTPRRGKAVEINALWYNALRLMERWLRRQKGDAAAAPIAEHAERARQSFNRRFWHEAGGYLYDVVDGEGGGDDPACRPNQIFAISLPNPVLDAARWDRVLGVVRERLLTPVGLRSLAPGHADYKPKYFGDLPARDAAYHQGTVWAWLIGPFVDAWLKVYPDDREGARKLLHGLIDHLAEACIGSVSEVFDAEAPYTPRGCVAQAWSVAELLRCWVKTAG